MSSHTCPACKQPTGPNDNFCQNCGAPARSSDTSGKAQIKSSGSYSGKMTRGGTSLFKRILYALLFIIVVGGTAMLVWFQMDPDAGKTLKKAMDMAGAGLVILIFVWVFFKGKRGRGRRDYDDDWDNDDGGDDD